MLYSIQNEFLKVEINDVGAELMSIKNKNDVEFLWQGDPKYWGGRAPIMFPICGRLYEGKYTYLGKEYSMPNHGIARKYTFSPSQKGTDFVTLRMVSDESTKLSYPFDFVFDVTFSLVKNELKIEYKVKNEDTKDLIFALGAHPAFNVPFGKDGKFEDYYLMFPKTADALRVDYSPACFCTHNDYLYKKEGTRRIDLKHELFDDDAIFLYNIPKEITLTSSKSKNSISVYFDDMKYVGLWHAVRTDAPYVCIEPWTSIPADEGVVDDLSTKKEMMHLAPGYTHKSFYTIKIS